MKERSLRRTVIGFDDISRRGRGVVDLLSAYASAVMSDRALLFGRRSTSLLSLIRLLRLLSLRLLLLRVAARTLLSLSQQWTHDHQGGEADGSNTIHYQLSCSRLEC